MENWIGIIDDAAEETIPKTKITYHIHARESDYLKLLEYQYNQLRNINGWTREQRELIRNIQEQLKEENLRLYREAWNNKIRKLNDIYNDPTRFWKETQKLMGSGTVKTPYIKDNRGNKIYDSNEKERKFREIWENIFKISPEENLNFNIRNKRMVSNYLGQHEFEIEHYQFADTDRLNPDNFMTRPTTREEIKQIIKEFKNGKAPGISSINKVMLMNLPDVAIDRLRKILNLTISMGYFPIIFKNGLIVLIPKQGKDPKDPNNYRPITLLEVPGKILERLINKRLHRYCEENNIFHPQQYGFRAKRGTDTAIAKLYETIAVNQKYKDHCNIVCRDISKAFDKVWHEGLKYKIIQINNLPSIIKKILCSYVVGRTAQIRIDNAIGPKFDLKSGVPQGGILSPTLFILYTRDLPPAGNDCDDVIFADDITQVIQNFSDNKEELAISTTREIERVNQFEKDWKIMININKFNLLSISKLRPHQVVNEGRLLNFSNEIKILGLTLKRTGIKQHITNWINLAKIQTNKLRRFSGLDTNIKLHLYKALVRPILEYPIIPNGLASATNLLTMQRIQNKNLKMIALNTDHHRETMEQLHERYEIETINIRFYRATLKLWNKMGESKPEIYQKSMRENNSPFLDHSWWKRVATVIEEGEPNPRYTQADNG